MSVQVHVIYVGDEPAVLEDRDEYTVTRVADSGNVYAELETSSADCLVCDPETVQWQRLYDRVRDRFGTIPFVLYGDVEEDWVEQSRKKGVDAFVPRTGSDAYLAVRVRECIEDGRQQVALTERTNARFRALTENIGVAIITIDTDSVVQFANPLIEDVLGWNPAELEGESLITIIPEQHRSEHFEAVEEYLETGERSVDWSGVRLTALHRDGHEVPVVVSFGEFSHNGNKYFSGVIAKIPDSKGLETVRAELVEARDALERDDAAPDVDAAVEAVGNALELLEAQST